MKTLRFRIVQLLSVLIIAAGVAVLAERNSRGQSPQTKSESQTAPTKTEQLVKPTILTTDRAAATTTAPLAFAEASAQNSSLHTDLIWTFGKKEQHGWYLYDLLIGQTLNVKPDASTGTF